ncbi:MAG: hypothetical protein ACRCXD_03205 [Luteolibacter sp.]
MKRKNIVLLMFLACLKLVNGKESLDTMKAFEAYEKNDFEPSKINLPPRTALSILLNKENVSTEVKETLVALQSVRNSPSKDLIPQLKELWKIHHKNTFRTKYADDWYFVRGIDRSQKLCNEIKKLIETMGGNVDDIEPIKEKNTFDLNEIRRFLGKIKDGSRKESLSSFEAQVIAKDLLQIIKTSKFEASSHDDKLHLFYILGIVEMLGDEIIWPAQKKLDAADPMIVFFDETLSMALTLIDEKWVPKPKDHVSDQSTAVQMTQQFKDYLEGYQQMNLRKLRDQILINVSNLIEMKRGDQLFKQEMIKRFAKNELCRKLIDDRLK